MKKFLYGMVLSLAIAMPVWAGLFPVPDNIKHLGNQWGYQVYQFTSYYLIDDPVADQIIPKGYMVWPAAYSPSYGKHSIDDELYVVADGVKTFGTLAIELTGRLADIRFSASILPVCFTYGAGPNANFGVVISGRTARCTPPETVTASCQTSGSPVVIDHGTITRTDTFSAEAELAISCTADVDVRLNLAEPNLRLGAGLSSVLSIEGSRDGRLSLKSGPNIAVIRSDLTNIAAAVGEYSASTVLYIVYP